MEAYFERYRKNLASWLFTRQKPIKIVVAIFNLISNDGRREKSSLTSIIIRDEGVRWHGCCWSITISLKNASHKELAADVEQNSLEQKIDLYVYIDNLAPPVFLYRSRLGR